MGFSFYACKNWQRTGWIITLIVFQVAFALVYDNSIVAMGNLLRKGDLLRMLTVGLFCLPFAVTLLLIWTSLEQDRHSGFGWDGNRAARFGTIGLTVMLVTLGITSEVHKNVLELRSEDGVPRYMLPDAIYTAIVPVVGTVANLIFGGILWSAKKLALNIPWNSHHIRC